MLKPAPLKPPSQLNALGFSVGRRPFRSAWDGVQFVRRVQLRYDEFDYCDAGGSTQ